MACAALLLLPACSGGGGSSSGLSTQQDAPQTQAALDAERDAKAAQDALLDTRASSNEELVEGVSLFNDSAASWFEPYFRDRPMVTDRYQAATLILFLRALDAQDDTLWDRYGYWDLVYYLRGEQPRPVLDDSGDYEAAAFQRQTIDTLEALHNEIEARLVQSISLHDPLAPSAEAMFPYLLENGLTWFPRGTAFFNYPFNTDALDAASDEATAVAVAYARGEPPLTFDELEDANFWERYAEHGGQEQGARVLASMLADRTFGLGTSPDLFDAIVADRRDRATETWYCLEEGLAPQISSFADNVFATRLGDSVDSLPLDPSNPVDPAEGFLLRVERSISIGATQAADLALIALGPEYPNRPPDEYFWGGMRVYREGERVLIYYAREAGSPRDVIVIHIELQGEQGICLQRSEYVELVAELSD